MKKSLLTALSIALLASASSLQAQQPTQPDAQRSPTEESQLRERQLNQQDGANQNKKSDVEQLAAWLAMANHMEVEISRVATEQASNEQVKQFAQKMVEAHSKHQEKLKQFMSPAKTQTGAQQPNDQGNRTAMHHNTRMQVGKEASKNKLSMTKQMLEKYQGQDFDMGYLSQQLVAHIDMLATLHAMKDQGTPEFQQAVKEGIKATEEHYKQAQVLAMKLEDKEGGVRSETNR